MKLVIEQVQSKKEHRYKVCENGKVIYTLKINTRNIFALKKVYLYDAEGKEVCSAIQENKVKYYIRFIPFVGLFMSGCTFVYYKGGKKLGVVNHRFNGGSHIWSKIDDDEYEVWNPKNTSVCIYHNDKQVALIIRKHLVMFDGDSYIASYNSSFSKELLIMLCIMSDLFWFETDNDKYAWMIQLGKRKLDENWKPED